MTTEFGNIALKTDPLEKGGELGSQAEIRRFLVAADGFAQNISDLFFHAAAVSAGAALQARLHQVFEIADDELGQGFLSVI